MKKESRKRITASVIMKKSRILKMNHKMRSLKKKVKRRSRKQFNKCKSNRRLRVKPFPQVVEEGSEVRSVKVTISNSIMRKQPLT